MMHRKTVKMKKKIIFYLVKSSFSQRRKLEGLPFYMRKKFGHKKQDLLHFLYSQSNEKYFFALFFAVRGNYN